MRHKFSIEYGDVMIDNKNNYIIMVLTCFGPDLITRSLVK